MREKGRRRKNSPHFLWSVKGFIKEEKKGGSWWFLRLSRTADGRTEKRRFYGYRSSTHTDKGGNCEAKNEGREREMVSKKMEKKD